jgi:hypothetical protein
LAVPKGLSEDAWVSLLENIVISAAEEFGPDLVLIWAGCDAHCDGEQGGGELEAVRAGRLGVRDDGGTRRRSVAGVRGAGLLTFRAASHVSHHWSL